ncbi:MAG: GAF domain-containing protein [Chloroflexi bacterium]|nr:GAF domain-containing protein [Chloroflexota bacterium]
MADLRTAGSTDAIVRNFRIAVVAAVLYFALLAIFWRRGPALAASPLYAALAEALAAFAALAIAFLTYSRYRTLGELAMLVVAQAFWVNAIFSAFALLTLPGIDGTGGLLTTDPDVVTWMIGLKWTALALGLSASLLVPAVGSRQLAVGSREFGGRRSRIEGRRPEAAPTSDSRPPTADRRPPTAKLGLFALTGFGSFAVAGLVIALGPGLPRLSVGGVYLIPFAVWMVAVAVAFVVLAFRSIQRFREDGNSVFGQVAVLDLAAAAILFGLVVGGQRYSLWWYVNQVLLVGGYGGMLFGLLNEYVSLFESERGRARQLAALDAITEVGLSTLEADELLRSLLERLLRELGGAGGAILLLESPANTLAVRAAVGLPVEQLRSVRLRPGEGFVGRAFQAGEPLTSTARARVDELVPALHLAGVQAVLATPMQTNGRSVGALYVDFLAPRRFADWELNLMRLAAERAAMALDRARLYEEARRHEAQARLLAQVGELFASTIEIGAILRGVVDRTAAVLTSTCAVFLRQGDQLIPEAIASADAERLEAVRHRLAETQLRVGQGLIGRVAASGQPVLVPDVATTDELLQDVRALLPLDVESIAVAPLTTRGQVLGVLAVAAVQGARRLDDEAFRLVVELAGRTAIAVDNARLHQEIVRQRDFLDTVLRTLPTPVAVLEGLELIYRLANRAVQEQVGANVEVIGRRLTDVLPTTAYDGTAALFRRVIETGRPAHVSDYEYTGLARGVTYWNLSLVPLKHEEGRPPTLLMLAGETTVEVQARRRVEELARESGQRASVLRAVLDAIDEGVLMVDPTGDVVLVNRTISRLFNLGTEFFQGRVSREAVFGWIRQRALDPGAFAAREDYLNAHPETELHDEVVLAVPSQRIFLRYSGPVRDADGNLIGRIEVYSDITEHRRREREREAIANAARDLVEKMEMEAVARAVAEHAVAALGAQVSAVWLAHPERHELQLIASRNLSPVTVDELRHERFDAKTVEAAAATSGEPIVLRKVDEAGSALEHTRVVARAEGLRSVVATPLVERGKLVGVLLTGWTTPQTLPATELHLAQTLGDLFALAIDNARLYESVRQEVRLREEFLAAAAHELKTPLTSLQGYSQLLLRRAPAAGNGERRALAAIDRSARRIAHLGEELLEALDLRRGAAPVQPTRFDLRELVEQEVKDWQQAGHTNPIRLPAVQSVSVESDRDLVRRLIEHLLDNAARRSPENTPIDLTTQTVGHRAVVRVRDYGPGIPEERQPHLFEPLYEAHPSGTAGYVGLVGLELYLARQIVQQLGGDIWFESQPGAGAVVAFSLPKVDVQSSVQEG